jgi:WXG100 family type VII secretion target
MATLHMDVDSVRSTQANIVSVKGQLNDQVNTIGQAVDSMVGSTWSAPGATQFQSEFQNWRTAMLQSLEQLEQLATRLNGEITEWESTAQNVA